MVNEKEARDHFEEDVRKMLKSLLPRSKRPEIAATLTRIMGREITKSMLDNFVAEGKYQPRLPLSLAKALCQVVDEPLLRRYLNSEEDMALVQIGEHARVDAAEPWKLLRELISALKRPVTRNKSRQPRQNARRSKRGK